jgi:hypothetical protein
MTALVCRGVDGRLALFAFGLLALSLALLMHLYWGIQHDAVLYTMQGLAHLHPDLYANDIFLKYGSQDHYSVFGSLYGAAIGALGMEHAAVMLTVLSQIALFLSAWWLSRRVMSPPAAALAVAWLAALELPYGAGGAFHLVEDFLTPRLLSEALVLAAIAASLMRRATLTATLLIASAAIHPAMAVAGVAYLMELRWFSLQRRYTVAAGIFCAGLLLLWLARESGPPLTFSEDWRQLAVARAPYLALANWTSLDCSRLCPAAATLCVLSIVTDVGVLRRLAISALALSIAGVLLTLIGGDLWHIVLVVQVQPWRWTWLAVALGTLLLPLTIARLWGLGTRGRCTLAVLLTVYCLQDEISAPEMTLLAVIAAWYAVTRLPIGRATQRYLLVGAVAMLCIGMGWDIANRFVYAKLPFIQFSGLPAISWMRQMIRSSVLPSLLLGAAWLAVFHRPTAMRLKFMTAGGVIALIAIIPCAAHDWSAVGYPAGIYEAFRAWRSLIPVGTEVLWVGNPLKAWIYLERPSYYSEQQLSTTLFSRTAATVMHQRLLSMAPFLTGEGIPVPVTPSSTELSLKAVCASGSMGFIATHHRFPDEALATLPGNLERPFGGLRLFRCDGSP